MMHLELIRFAYLPEYTLGTLRTPEFELATIERPWLPNPDGPGGQIGLSCVPDGQYVLRHHDSPRFPDTFALTNPELGVYYQTRPEGQAWGRTAILMHQANRVREVIGCIAVGERHGRLYGSRAVLASKAGMDRLRALLRGSERVLTIRPTEGTE